MSASALRLTGHIPQTPGAIWRDQLLGKLQTLAPFKVILLSAPPGYGKTTLASQLARRSGLPVVWHSVQLRERDLPNLYAHSTLALEQVMPGVEGSLVAAENASPAELARKVADALQAIGGECLYMLDDAHHLESAPAAEHWLQSLVDYLPARCHLLIASRRVPNLSFSELISRGEILAVGEEELRLTEDEIHQLASLHSREPLRPAELERLSVELGGWPAGVTLALQPLPAALHREMLGTETGPEALFESLARMMLRAQPPDLQRFLLSASTLSHLTPELCTTVLGLSSSLESLTEAQQQNLFLSRASGGLMFHALFRDFLQRQLEALDPAAFTDLHLRAARWYESQDDLDEAFDHYLLGGAVENAVTLANNAAISYFNQGRHETLLDWNASLRDAGETAPVVAYHCAVIQTERYEYDAAVDNLDHAERIYRAANDEGGLTHVELYRGWIAIQQGNFYEAIQRSRPYMHISQDALRGRALRTIGVAYLHLGKVRIALKYLLRAVELHRSAGLVSALSHVLQDVQHAYQRLGMLTEAGECLQEVVALRRRLGAPSALALALNNLGYYYHQRSDYEQALATLEEGLNMIAGIFAHRTEAPLLISYGDLKRDLGLFREAERFYQKALEVVPRLAEPRLNAYTLISLATLRRWQGRLEDAIFLAEEALASAREHNLRFEAWWAQAALSAARLATCGSSENWNALLEARDGLLAVGARYELLAVLGWTAHLHVQHGNETAAKGCLEVALKLARDLGSAQPIAAEASRSSDLTEMILEHYPRTILAVDLDKLLQARRKADQLLAPQVQPSGTTYSLRVLTFGQEAVERNGQRLPTSAWRGGAARQLFLYLLFEGERSREEIGLEFCPDASTEQIRNSFHTTLHRARQALGVDVITFNDQTSQYSISSNLSLWCDALEFERLIAQARTLPLFDARAEDLYRKSVALYAGDFLPLLDAHWTINRREALREAFMDALIGLGKCSGAREDYREAIAAFKRALSIDPYREDIHRQIIGCYVHSGQRYQAHRHYTEMKRQLRDELGIEPARETVELVTHLLG